MERVRNVNVNQFLNINTKELSYFLGFLWADGWINEINSNKNVAIKINKDDADVLLKPFSKLGKWNVHTYKTKWKDSTTIITNNHAIYDFLYEA